MYKYIIQRIYVVEYNSLKTLKMTITYYVLYSDHKLSLVCDVSTKNRHYSSLEQTTIWIKCYAISTHK